MRKLTDQEKRIKRINSRIVQQVQTYGINNSMLQEYLSDLVGLPFVVDVPRKVGTDSSGNPIMVKVPQIKGSQAFMSSSFIKAFDKKKTPGREIMDLKSELRTLKKEYAKLDTESKERLKAAYDEIDDILKDPSKIQQLEEEYIQAKNDMEDTISRYYDRTDADIIDLNYDIQRLRDKDDRPGKYEIITIYRNIKAELTGDETEGIGKA